MSSTGEYFCNNNGIDTFIRTNSTYNILSINLIIINSLHLRQTFFNPSFLILNFSLMTDIYVSQANSSHKIMSNNVKPINVNFFLNII